MNHWVRRSIAAMFGKRPAAMQVGAMCRSRADGKVLLVTSRGTGRWIIPKGWPMGGRSLAAAALQEAWEEGGVRGAIDREELGRYSYEKAQDSGFSIPVEVRVFSVWVSDLNKDFPEAGQRKRRWVTAAEAAEMVNEPGLKALLDSLPGVAA